MASVTFTLNIQKAWKTEPKVLTFHKSKDINVANLKQLLGIQENEIFSVIEGDDYSPDSNPIWRRVEREEDLGLSSFTFTFLKFVRFLVFFSLFSFFSSFWVDHFHFLFENSILYYFIPFLV
jgi:hypothetical protein